MSLSQVGEGLWSIYFIFAFTNNFSTEKFYFVLPFWVCLILSFFFSRSDLSSLLLFADLCSIHIRSYFPSCAHPISTLASSPPVYLEGESLLISLNYLLLLASPLPPHPSPSFGISLTFLGLSLKQIRAHDGYPPEEWLERGIQL